MEFSSIPTALLTSSKAPAPIQVTRRRPESVFHPSVWGDHFLAYYSVDMEVDINMKQNHQQLKEKVRKQLVEAKGEYSQQLDLIDAIQRLGVAYHFKTEIDQGLHQIYQTYHQSGHKNVNNDEDLYITALSFRLLRQHGYRVSCDVFNKLKDNEGKFKESLIGDVRGLLSLYEATFLSVRQEDILDEAMEFTAARLNSALPNLSNNPIAAQVVHALDQPIHKGLTRLESRRYISFYDQDDSHNKVLLDFAKLDFNLLQKLHQRELSEITRWWKDLDVPGKLPFARDRVVELYFWMLGVYYEPQYILGIRILTKTVSLISLIDDIYDASNATIEELVLFNDAIQRWEVISALDHLPDHMKIVYQKILDTYNIIDDEMAKQGRSYGVEYAKFALKDLVGAYLLEAKWYHEGYVPSMDEHMALALLSCGYKTISTLSLIGMGELATKEAFDWVSSFPLIVHASSVVNRLMDDVAGHKFEQERGHLDSTIECYMKQYGATEEDAIMEFQKRVTNAWKDMNSECLRPTSVPMPILQRPLNLARVIYLLYKGGDNYTHSGTKLKRFVTLVLVDSVPT
ncbi:(-)-germacrene D synthase-like isoform X2 [Rhododendron vialii]|uniref:(-)-germacrene D synthase-like isoform X2 n=1 Tax=Rhododendron vialii TaxID=182163 RepID=UPI00265E7FEA|nr:(-)-germacrene D synthase-like isoform X2 [Rhododendron vialii]